MTNFVRFASVAALSLGLVFTTFAESAHAQPIPSATISPNPLEPFSNEDFTFTVSMENSAAPGSGFNGFNFELELLLPPDVTLNLPIVSPLFGSLTPFATIVVPISGQVTNPITGEVLSGLTPGLTYVLVEIPLGTVTPETPPVAFNFSATMSGTATPGVTLSQPITAAALFAYGTDPLDNQSSDPVVRNSIPGVTVAPIPSTQGAAAQAPVTPVLYVPTKTAATLDGNGTATGPNYPIVYTLEADIARASTLTPLRFAETIPNNLRFTGFTDLQVNASTGDPTVTVSFTRYDCGVSQTPVVLFGPAPLSTMVFPLVHPDGTADMTQPPNDVPGGCVVVTLSSATGELGGGDVVVEYEAYVPLNDATMVPVLPAPTGTDNLVINTVTTSVTTGSGGYGTVSLVGGDITTDPAEVVAESLNTQKSEAILVDTGPVGLSPGDTVRVTLAVQISDYFSFRDLALHDVIGDGLDFNLLAPANARITLVRENGSNAPSTPVAFSLAAVSPAPNSTVPGQEYPFPAAGTLLVTQNARPGEATGVSPGFTTLVFDLSEYWGNECSVSGTACLQTSDCPITETCVLSGDAEGGFRDLVSTATGFIPGIDDDSRLIITYDLTLQDAYENPASYTEDPSIDALDAVSNNEIVIGEITSDPAGQFLADEASAGLSVPPTELVKALVAVNGSGTLPIPLEIEPGDDVTYSLRITIPTGSVELARLQDFLPLPVFHTDDPDADTVPSGWTFDNVVLAPGVFPAAGRAAFGPVTSNVPGEYVPTDNPPAVATNLDANSVSFNFPDQVTFQVTTPQEIVAEVLFTIRAGNDPFGDGLFLTNVVQATFGNSLEPTVTESAVLFRMREPALRLTKGVSATSGSGTISPSPAILPVNGNLSGADAGDTITYVVTMENRGGYPAYDVIVTDPQVPGMAPGSCAVASVTYGDGSPLAYGGTLAAGLTLSTPLDENDGTLGAPFSIDTALITVTCVLDAGVQPHDLVRNSATITRFTSIPGGPNFVDPAAPASGHRDVADVTIAAPTIDKAVASVAPQGAGPGNVTSGDVVTYALTVTLPEGVTTGLSLLDTFPAGFEYVAASVVVDTTGYAGSVTTTPSVVLGGSVATGQTVAINLATATTTNDNVTTNNTFVVRLQALVRGDLVQNDGLPSAQTKTNTVAMDYDANPGAPLTDTAVTQFREPELMITKSMAPSPADGGDTLTVTLTVTNTGTGPAHDVVVNDPLDGALFDLGTIAAGTTPVDFAYSYASPNVTYTMVPAGSIAAGASRVFTFTGQIRADVVIQTTYSNTANVAGDSQDGVVPSERSVSDNDSTTVNIVAATVAKNLIATSEPATSDAALGSNPPVAIGEVLTFRIVFKLPEGTIRAVRLADILPTGLQHIPGTAFLTRNSAALVAANNVGNAPSAGINVDPPFTPVPITLSGVSGEVLINLGNVSNSANNNLVDETYTLELKAVVLNSASNNAGVTRSDRGRLRYQNGVGTELLINTANVNVHVAEPVVLTTKSALPLSGSAGDTVTFTLVVANTASGTNGATGFNWAFSDLLPSEYTNPLVVSVNTAAAPGAVANAVFGPGNQLTGTIDELDAGESITVTYTADIDVSARYGQQILNTASTTATSLEGTNGTGGDNPGAPGGATGERTGAGGVNDLSNADNAVVSVHQPTIAKTIANPQSWFAIGQVPRFRITVGVPSGSTNALVVTDVLPAGLLLNGGTLTVTPPAGFTSSNSPLTDANPAFFTQSGQTLTLNFGMVTVPTAGNLVIEYDTTVANVLANQDGVTLLNQVTLAFENPANPPATITIGPVPNDTLVRVGEPNLSMGKGILAGAVGSQAGDTVTWRVVITNTGHTTAYRTAWTDVLPSGGGGPGSSAGLEQISNVSVLASGGTVLVNATALPVVSGDAIVSTTTNTNDTVGLPLIDIEPGATVTIDFDSVVGVNAVIGASLVNAIEATYDSLANGTGRDATSGPAVDDDNNADLNNYREAASATLVLDSPIAINKFVVPALYTVGEDISFVVRVDLFEGVTDSVLVTDNLPAGLTFQSSSIGVGNIGVSFSNPTYATPIIGGGGQDISFDFGDISNPPNVSTMDDFVDITIVARVDNILANQDGVVLENDTFLTYGPGATRLDFDSDGGTPGIQGLDVEIIEPDLQITKSLSPSSQSLGDLVTFTVTVTHTGASRSDAFDLAMNDTLPVGLTIIPSSVTLPPADFLVVGQTLTASRSSLTLADGMFSFTYQARIDNDAVVGQPLTNGISLLWSGLPGATGAADNGRTGSGGVNDYNDSAADTVVPDTDAFLDATKTVALLVDADFSGNVTAGDTLRYTVVLDNQTQTVDNVVFSDTIPVQTTYVAASLASSAGVPDDSGAPTLLVAVGTMAVPSTETITFNVTVNPGYPDGTLICNQGSVDSDETVPEPTDVDGVDANGDQCTPSVIGDPVSPRNELYVEKRVALQTDNDASGTVTSGDRLRYTLVFHNFGNQTLTGVTFADVIPTGLTGVVGSGVISGPGSMITVTATTVSSFVPSILAAATAAATFDVLVDAPLYNGSGDGDPNRETFVNQGTGDSDQTTPVLSDGDGDPTDGLQPTTIDAVDGVAGAPNVDVQKRVVLAGDVDGDGLVDPGDGLRYTISVTNTGSTTATNVVLVDPQPNNTTIVAGSTVTSQGSVVSETPVTVNIGSMPVGTVVTITMRVTVNLGTPDGTIILNQATATGNNFPPEDSDDNGNDGDGDNPNRTPVDGGGGGGAPSMVKALLSTTEASTVGAEVAVGEIVTYRVTATMPAGTTRQVELLDTLPAGLAYLGGSATLARVFDVNLLASANPGGINSAPSGVPVALSDGVGVVLSGQNLSVFLGDVINSDGLPNNETYVLVYRAIVRNVVGNQRGTTLINNARLSYWNGLSQANTASSSQTLTVVEPELAVVKTAAPTLVAVDGDTVSFSITVTNAVVANDATAFDARILDTIPAVFVNPSAVAVGTSGGVSGVTNNSAGNLVDVTVAVFPPGGQVVLTFSADVVAPYSTPSATNTVNVSWTSLPGTNGTGGANSNAAGSPLGERTGAGAVNDHAAEDSVIVRMPVLHLSKVDDPDPASPGGTLTYTVFITNSATVPLTNLVLEETYDPRTTFVSANPVPDIGNNQWVLGDLDGGESTTVTSTVTVNAGLADGTILLNHAHVTSDDNGYAEDDEPTTIAAPGIDKAQLHVQKDVSTVSVPAGAVMTYTLTVRNDGQATSYATVFGDTLPAGTTYANAVPAPTLVSGNYIEWSIGNLVPGAARTYTVYAYSDPTLQPGTIIENCANAIGQTGPGTTAGSGLTSQGCVASTVSAAADCGLVSRKRAVGLVVPSGEFVYRCLWCDPCVDAADVVIVDELPPQLELISVSTNDADSVVVTGQRIEMRISRLAAGRAGAANFHVRVRDNAAIGSVLRNDLEMTDAALRVKTGTAVNTVRELTTDSGSTSLSIVGSKRAPDGGRLSYSARFGNLSDASSVSMVVSSQIQLTSVSPRPSSTQDSLTPSGEETLMVWNNLSGAGTIKIRGLARLSGVASVEVGSIDAAVTDVQGDVRTGLDTLIYEAGTNPATNAGTASRVSLTAPRFAKPGLLTQFSLRYRSMAGGVSATLTLPAGMTATASYPAASSTNGSVLTWNSLRPGSGAVKVRAVIPTNTILGTTLIASALVTDDRGSLADSVEIPLIPGAGGGSSTLTLTTVSYVVAGAQTTATLRYGNVEAGTVVEMTLPPGVGFASAVPAPSSVQSGLVRWVLPAATSGKISPRLVIGSEVPSGTTLTVTSTIVGGQPSAATMTVR